MEQIFTYSFVLIFLGKFKLKKEYLTFPNKRTVISVLLKSPITREKAESMK